VTARLIGNSGGFVRAAMVNAGSDQGVARGQAAIAEGGLIGRLTEIGNRAARILLITDLNSRIPVAIPASRTSAVLAGDNSERPRLVFASEPKAIKIGDRVVTSGDGGVFPPGLPVGVVAALDQDGARVEPYAELSQLDYVLLIDYGLAGDLPQSVPAGRGQDRRGRAPIADEKKAH
jgi:rod shape-determining protein MreC